jgi:hypothetical protein
LLVLTVGGQKLREPERRLRARFSLRPLHGLLEQRPGLLLSPDGVLEQPCVREQALSRPLGPGVVSTEPVVRGKSLGGSVERFLDPGLEVQGARRVLALGRDLQKSAQLYPGLRRGVRPEQGFSEIQLRRRRQGDTPVERQRAFIAASRDRPLLRRGGTGCNPEEHVGGGGVTGVAVDEAAREPLDLRPCLVFRCGEHQSM